MYEYSNFEGVDKKQYIQVDCMKFYSFVKKNYGESERLAIHKHFCDHHCDIFRNDSMFIFERFFCGDDYAAPEVWDGGGQRISTRTWHYLKLYIEKHGLVSYSTPEEYNDAEVDCIFPGYDGILMNVTW